MRRNGYAALGYVVWHGVKWLLRLRVPSRREIAGAAIALLAALLGAIALAKRAAA